LGVQIVEIDSDIIIENFEILAISFGCFFAILWQGEKIMRKVRVFFWWDLAAKQPEVTIYETN